MQSVIQMFVARFASRDPLDAERDSNVCGALYV
jgi:hypothetical protein